MGHFTVLYGCICGSGDFAEENAARIAALPEHDTRPSLVRDMFAVPSMEHAYHEQLISFGLYYNRLETRWLEWLAKFEDLLRTLYWDEVHGHLLTEYWGEYHCVWKPVPYDSTPNVPVTRWTYEGLRENILH